MSHSLKAVRWQQGWSYKGLRPLFSAFLTRSLRANQFAGNSKQRAGKPKPNLAPGSDKEQPEEAVTYFKERPKDVRQDRHRQAPTMPFPWDQLSLND
jgi:hypothetical protein